MSTLFPPKKKADSSPQKKSGKKDITRVIVIVLWTLFVAVSIGVYCLFSAISKGRIGYMPQQSSAQRDFPASVREVVLSGCVGGTGFLPFYSRAQKAAARANMDMLGVTPFAKKNYRALSGGQQQRVLLCRALCAAGEVLLDRKSVV